MIPQMPPTEEPPLAARAISALQVDAAQGRFAAAPDRDAVDNDGQNLRAEPLAFERNFDDENVTEDSEHCGDPLLLNDNDKILRIGFVNCNGIPPLNAHPKNSSIFTTLTDHSFDIVGMAEVNLCWNKIASSQRWKSRTLGWWETSSSILAYNINDISNSYYQPGGTMQISINKAAHRIIQQGRDPSGLGRWCWSLFRGKHNILLRVITLYRPCEPSTGGYQTAYSQQQRYFDIQHDNRCPRNAAIEDALQFVQQCLDDGEQVVFMLDANENLRTGPISQTLHQMGLMNAILNHHNITDDVPTHHRGTYSIDGIFHSRTLRPEKSGMAPFGTFPSDHRLLWVDFTYENAFGFHMPTLVYPQARRLKCNDPRVVRKFQDHYKMLLLRHNIPQQLFTLQQELQYPISPQQIAQYESLRQQCLQFLKSADNQCRNLRMGNLHWSPMLQHERDVIQVWEGVVKRRKGARFSRSKIKRLAQKCSIQSPLTASLEEAQTHLQQAYEAYHTGKRVHKERRTTFLESLAQARAQATGGTSENQLRMMIHHETMRNSFRQIKYALGTLNRSGVTSVKEPQPDGSVIEYTAKEDVEQACMRENERKYTQTERTPCLRAPLLQEIGLTGNSDACERILRGTYIPPHGTSPHVREFLAELKYHPFDGDHPPTTILTSDFVDFWTKKKEQVSSGISGIHYGHMKACSKDKLLSDVEATLAHIPYVTGYTPSAWTFGIDCMIPKKIGLDLVTKLRTIVLCEAGMTFNNSKLAKDTMQHAEKHSMLAPEQYGSRNGKKAIDHAVHKRLTYDLFRQSRKPGALCSNDARSCYDRILHSIATLAFRRLGIPFDPVRCMFTSIANMSHHTRTTFGDSTFNYNSQGRLIPFQGVLQGNAAAPIIWVVVSTPLLNMLRTAENGAHIISAISKERSSIIAFAFVDDTDLPCADFRDADILTEEVMEQMQEAIDRWEGGLKTTGGAIAPEKSWVYPIDFDFTPDGTWYYRSPEEIDFAFTVRDHDDIRQPLPQFDASTGKETLGVILAPDGNNDDAFTHMLQQSCLWADHVKTGHLNASDVWRALHTTVLKQLEYPLPALTLTQQQCKQILKPVLDIGLSRSHICRNMARAVVHGPSLEAGLGISDLYTHQGISHICLFNEHLHLPTMTGQLIRASMEWATVELGLGNSLFRYEFDTFNFHLTDCWIKHLWQFCNEHNIIIDDYVTPSLRLRRRNDHFIMNSIITTGYSPHQLQSINRCRMYLRATTLSDITTGFGDQINKDILRGIRDEDAYTPYLWPRQPRPDERSWRLWRKALRESFPHTNRRLTTPLGSWHDGHRDQWRWFYQPHTNNLYQRFGNMWRIWQRTSRRGRVGRLPKFRYHSNSIGLPPGSQRATIKKLPNRIVQLTGYYRERQPEAPQPRTQGLDNIPSALTSTPNTLQRLINGLRHNTSVLVSDGSFHPDFNVRSAAFVWAADDNHTDVCVGRIITPGELGIHCSHRSELSGLLSGILYITDICKTHNILNGHITIGCDGLGAISACSEFYEVVSSNRKHFDLLRAIATAIDKSPLTWNFKHVKAHQDETKAFHDLSFLEKLNVYADDYAKQYLQDFLTRPDWRDHIPTRIYMEPCTILFEQPNGYQYKIGSQLSSTLRFLIHQSRLRDYWTKKNKFHPQDVRKIDWDSLHKSTRAIPPSQKIWLSKWISNTCGVGIKLKQWKHQPHDNCPRCLQPVETVDHVLRCPHAEANDLWTQSIIQLDQYLTSLKTNPDITFAICSSLRAWHDGTPLPPINTDDDILRRALREQDQIGWRPFIDGFHSLAWRECQSSYFRTIRSQRSSLVWKSLVTRRIWKIAWEMWTHRNSILHTSGQSTHRSESPYLDQEIRNEYLRGHAGLTARHRHLFTRNLQQILRASYTNKRAWLASVYAARDHAASTSQQIRRQRPQIVTAFYDRWKARHTNAE
jgi:hypothetical protein